MLQPPSYLCCIHIHLQYLQSQLPSGTVPVFANSLCPEACLDMPSTGLFLYTRDKQSAAVKNWCACDPNMLQAAGSELQVCVNRVGFASLEPPCCICMVKVQGVTGVLQPAL
jgi:hypothetical protein